METPLPPPPPPTPAIKASKVIALSAIGVVSLVLVGYCAAQQNEEVTADCVDMSNQQTDGTYEIVDDQFCDDDANGRAGFYGGSHGAYHWYYGGTRIGTRVWRGSTFRPSDVNISSRTGRDIQRGGFGSHWGGGG
ncbi:hypothetical protein ACIBHX_01430 [Nonomuraea sp. NPDC050536]|uniref:hypothetical protein n=1 Tax=Nonomuraea sp. NPDC050536 TaxID=3364366 RepID=UPI0037C75F7D